MIQENLQMQKEIFSLTSMRNLCGKPAKGL